MAQILGFDISHFQGVLDYSLLKQNVEFVLIKTTEGDSIIDGQFARNQSEARRVGLLLGYYHFAHPELNAAQHEAEFFVSTIGVLHPGEVVCLDYENMSFSTPVQWCLTFLQTVENKTQIKPLIYLNQSLLSAHDWTPVIQAGYGLWLAQYTDTPDSLLPPVSWPIVAMRQYTNARLYQGNQLDGNVFYGDIHTFMKYGAQGALPVPTTPPASTDLQEILTHFQVKDKNELFSVIAQQYTYRDQARAEVQLLNEKYADYDKVRATRDAYLQQYDDLQMWLKEITGSATDDIAINKAEVVTRFGKESDLAQSLNDAQKALDSERQRHLSDVANLTTRANDLDVSIQKQQSEYVLLQNQVHDLQTQLSSQQQTGIKLTWIQQVVLNLQLLVKGKK